MPSHATSTIASLLAVSLVLVGCASNDSPQDIVDPSAVVEGTGEDASTSSIERFEAQVLEHLPFDARLFTQGLEVTSAGDVLVGTGQYGESGIFTLPVGEDSAHQHVRNEDSVFGEGITQYQGTEGPVIWQLSWDSGEAYKYDANSFELLDTASYPGEGWGLCSLDDTTLVMSDGTDELRHIDGETFAELDRVHVTMNGQSIDNINELECVNGEVFANIWFSSTIVRIDPISGEVTGTIDASGLDNNAESDPDNVLNGIAHIPGTEEFYLTGKRWPDMYRVSFTPVS